jgi:hypothetical protein
MMSGGIQGLLEDSRPELSELGFLNGLKADQEGLERV